MDYSVSGQITLRNEGFRALGTDKRFPAGMYAHVFREVRIPRERFETHVASEGFDAGVNYRVLPQVRASRKGSVALRTVVGLIVLMDTFQMCGVLNPVRKTHVAAAAEVRHCLVVGIRLVGCTLGFVGKCLVAEFAHGDIPAFVQVVYAFVLVLADVWVVFSVIF